MQVKEKKMSMIQDNNFPVPYETSFIKTDDEHELYIEQLGNSEGIPIIFLHGGPGSGCQNHHRNLFDLESCRIIFLDQRGAGKSLPKRSLNNNTTGFLIKDIELVRKKLNIKKWVVVGGSWGSTLGIAYAEEYNQYVNGLVLRSVFLGTKTEIEWAFSNAAKLFRPEIWNSWENLVRTEDANMVPINFYGSSLESEDKFISEMAAHVWANYESILSQIESTKNKIPKSFNDKYLNNSSVKPNTPYFEWHYIKNNFFLEDGQLLNNAHKLNGIPGAIIQGRYDLLCPPVNAFNIAEIWKDSELLLVEEGGHSANSGPMRDALIDEISKLITKLL